MMLQGNDVINVDRCYRFLIGIIGYPPYSIFKALLTKAYRHKERSQPHRDYRQASVKLRVTSNP